MKQVPALFLALLLAFSSLSFSTPRGSYPQGRTSSDSSAEKSRRKMQEKIKRNKAALAAKRAELCRNTPRLCNKSHQTDAGHKATPKAQRRE
jgi:hypothetical protein